jgi:WhiB family redox-sensing transcriptional regulator
MSVLFYPPLRPEKKVVRLSREASAKAVCAGCPVAAACLQSAFANDERYGIWGGLTDRERRLAAPPAQ